MPVAPHDLILLCSAGVGVLSWSIVVPHRLAGSARLYLIPPALLALAAFLPIALAIGSGDRGAIDDGQLMRILAALYLLGATTTYLFAPTEGRTTDKRLLWLLLGLWAVAALSDWNAELSPSRLSFWVVPVVLVVAWRLRPNYRDAVRLIGWVCLAVCAASLALAYFSPEVAFITPARVATILSTERLAGVVEHPNGLGLFAAVGTLLWWRRWSGFTVCALALVATDSRTAWFACAAGLLVLWLGARHTNRSFSRRQLLWIGAALALVAWLILTYAAPDQDQGLTFTGRAEVWSFVADHWDESPIIGHGPSAWQELISTGQVAEWAGQGHNQFVQNLYSLGLIGTVLLAALLWRWTAVNIRFARRGYLLPLALEGIVVVFSLFETPLTLLAIGGNLWLVSLLMFLRPD